MTSKKRARASASRTSKVLKVLSARVGAGLALYGGVIIERTDDRTLKQLVLVDAFERGFRAPRGVVFRADETLEVGDNATGVIETKEQR